MDASQIAMIFALFMWFFGVPMIIHASGAKLEGVNAFVAILLLKIYKLAMCVWTFYLCRFMLSYVGL